MKNESLNMNSVHMVSECIWSRAFLTSFDPLHFFVIYVKFNSHGHRLMMQRFHFLFLFFFIEMKLVPL